MYLLNTDDQSASGNEVQTRLGKVYLGKSNEKKKEKVAQVCFSVTESAKQKYHLSAGCCGGLVWWASSRLSMLPCEVRLLNGAESVAEDQCGMKHLFAQDCNAVSLIQSRFMSFLLHCSILSGTLLTKQ